MSHLHVVLVSEAGLSSTDMDESIAVLMSELEFKKWREMMN